MKYNVCVQGLGFVGSAMAIAIASQGHGKYSVVGIDLETDDGMFLMTLHVVLLKSV